MSKAKRLLEIMAGENQVKITPVQFIKLLKTGNVLGNKTNANRYTDDARWDDYLNNKPTGWYPVEFIDFEYSPYVSMYAGKIYQSPDVSDDAYEKNLNIRDIIKDTESKFKKGTMYFAKDDLIGYYNKGGYFIIDSSNPTTIEAKVSGSYYQFKTKDNKDLYSMFKK